jgi:hypothetical protein
VCKRIWAAVAFFGLLAILSLVSFSIPYRPVHGQTTREPADNSALRALLVELRTRVEMMQLEHDAARAMLLPMLKWMSASELLKETDRFQPILVWATQMKAFLADTDLADRGLQQAIAEAMSRGQELDPEEDRKRSEALRVVVDRKKKEFAKLVAALNEAKLELIQLERQDNAK